MKKRLLILISLTVLLLLGLGNTPSYADEAALGRQAEEAGNLRQALKHYVNALQSTSEGSSIERRLREKIIKLVQKIQPPPAVPEEAKRRMARGRAAVKAAKDEQGFLRAANEFKKAVRAAPWLAYGYYNLGVVQDKAGRYDDAIQSFNFYLLAAPNASDSNQIETKIYELEYAIDLRKRQMEYWVGTWAAVDPVEFTGRCDGGPPSKHKYQGSAFEITVPLYGGNVAVRFKPFKEYKNKSYHLLEGEMTGMKLTASVRRSFSWVTGGKWEISNTVSGQLELLREGDRCTADYSFTNTLYDGECVQTYIYYGEIRKREK